ncbi:MAG TPA: hypothetical protein DCY07_04490 [Rhodospirillaceae bacterium]|nr:hypothetical protein [Rhodospirillaceae bacterium]
MPFFVAQALAVSGVFANIGASYNREFSMRCHHFGLLALLTLAACSGAAFSRTAEFWRPISEPNVLMPLEKAQMKLDFDLSQCNCGIFPSNVPQPDLVEFQVGQQRHAQTGYFRSAGDERGCSEQPSVIVSECMRSRGWELTTCSGRIPLASGGAICAAATAGGD